jgi:hypothetical protein
VTLIGTEDLVLLTSDDLPGSILFGDKNIRKCLKKYRNNM